MISSSRAARAIRVDMNKHECAAKDFLQAWLVVALRGYMAKHGPNLTPAQQAAWHKLHDRPNAEALDIRLGLAQRDRNEGADQAFDSVRKKMERDKRAIADGDPVYYNGYCDAQADVRRGILETRKLSAKRPGGLGRELPRKGGTGRK